MFYTFTYNAILSSKTQSWTIRTIYVRIALVLMPYFSSTHMHHTTQVQIIHSNASLLLTYETLQIA